jgi:dnd system-associated protein 4
MSETETDRDTVMIDESVHEIYKRMTDGTDPITAPFRTMKDVFMFAACLGYQKGGPRPLKGKKLTIFRWAQFSPQTDVPILKAISIAQSGDVEVLRSQEAILTIAEQYANAGIHELRARVLKEQGQPLWNVVSNIQ